jgi:hypothetical protein
MKQIQGSRSAIPVAAYVAATFAVPIGEDQSFQNASANELKLRPVQLSAGLSTKELSELDKCEGVLERGLATFFEVGNALLSIRENRLYRGAHRSFEDYCRERWNIGRSYACRVMGAAERVNQLPENSGLPRPSNEFQVRPFLKLSAEEFPGAWKRAVNKAKSGNVTAPLAMEVIKEMTSDRSSALVRKKRRPKSTLHLGQIVILLTTAKQLLERRENEQAIEVLDRIESLLFESN